MLEARPSGPWAGVIAWLWWGLRTKMHNNSTRLVRTIHTRHTALSYSFKPLRVLPPAQSRRPLPAAHTVNLGTTLIPRTHVPHSPLGLSLKKTPSLLNLVSLYNSRD